MKSRHVHLFQFFVRQFIVVCFTLFLSAGNVFCEQDTPPPSIGSTLTLNQAVEVALKNNRSLQRSRLSLESSNLNVQLQNDTFDIKIIPATSINYNDSVNDYLSASVGFAKKTKVGISGSITPRIERSEDITRLSVSVLLNVPLLRGLGTDYNLDGVYSSLHAYHSANRSHQKQQDNLVIDTVSTVYSIINLQKQISLLNTQVAGLKQHISLTEIKEKTGLASAMDMYRAELRLKEVQNELTIIEKQFENQTDRLKTILAIPMQGELTVAAPIDYEPVVINLDQAVNIALENRIEIEQSERNIEESRRKMIIAKRDILPIINLNLGYRKYDNADSSLDDSNSSFLGEEDWTVSLSGSSDLSRSSEKTAFEQANIRLQQSKIDLESTREDITREVRSQINQMTKKERLIIDRSEQLRQAQGKLELALSKFNHQLADNFDLLEAQTQRQQVETDLLVDNIGYIVDTYKLRSVLGTLIKR